MRVNGAEVTVKRGESFTLDFSFTNKDGSPYIVNRQFLHPYILVTIASNSFSTGNKYEYNSWCDASMFYRFESSSVTAVSGTDWDTVLPTAECLDDDYFVEGPDGAYYCYYSVYSLTVNGETTYRIWQADNNDPSTGAWVEYQFRVVVSYDSDVTSKWTSQDYLYSITLVDGQLMRDTLVQLYENKFGEQPDASMTNSELYEALTNAGVTFREDFDPDYLLYEFDTYLPLLGNSRLTVLAALQGGN